MENKKQTAVEFAVAKLEKFIPSDNQIAVEAILEQAKEMEKYQILDAYVEGSRFKVDIAQSTPDGIEPEVMGAVDYYDNVYNK
jgi:hypothetical protein